MAIGIGSPEEEIIKREVVARDPRIPIGTDVEIEKKEWQMTAGYMHPKQLTDLDVIDIATRSLKVGKLNNCTRIKIIESVVRELKAFYGN